MHPEQFEFFDIFSTIRRRTKQKVHGQSPKWDGDGRTRDFERGQSKLKIQKIVERVSSVRDVPFEPLFSKKRESEAIASARSFAIAACAAVGVPLCHVARTFGRSWACCYVCEVENANKYRRSSAFRSEWDSVTKGFEVKPLQLHSRDH